MLASTTTSVICGIEAVPVEVEAHVRGGPPKFTIIGLGDGAVRESKDRVQSALRQSGFHVPDQVLVNLAPAELKKEGSSFDLAVSLAILAASRQINPTLLAGRSFYGELGLDGRVKPIRGALSFALEASSRGVQEILVPAENIQEVRRLKEIRARPVTSLRQVVQGLGREVEEVVSVVTPYLQPDVLSLDEVCGQEIAKRALTIAAAGGHNVLMVGPPGCGKSMLAERLPSILPALTDEEIIETIKIHSVAGESVTSLLAGVRPFRAPHHGVSDAGLIGGGSVPRPGEISLAHRGVLFLDEFPEFRRGALEALRAPLEKGTVQITRAKWSVNFPARFQLVAAMNPCPCGVLGTAAQKPCQCSRSAIESYLRKLSRPILDRIDLQFELQPVPLGLLRSNRDTGRYRQEGLKTEVVKARLRQAKRCGECNAYAQPATLKPLSSAARALLEKGAEKLGLSARGFIRAHRVAATISDLAGSEDIQPPHVAEALSFRALSSIENYVRGGVAASLER